MNNLKTIIAILVLSMSSLVFALSEKEEDLLYEKNLTLLNYDALLNGAEVERELIKLGEGGHPESQKLLATMYIDGDGVYQDFSEALYWAFKAVVSGSLKIVDIIKMEKYIEEEVDEEHGY